MRMREAAKRALRGPLVPRRQETLAPSRFGQHRLGGGGELVGDLVLPRPAAPGDGEDERDIGRVDLLVLRDAHGPGEAASAEALSERCGQTIAGVRQHQAEAHAQRRDAIDLLEGDLRLGARGMEQLWHTGGDHAFNIIGPALGQEQAQAEGDGHLVPRECHGHQRLAVGALAEHGGVLRRHAHRMGALLGQAGVVDDEDGVRSAHEAIGRAGELCLDRGLLPQAVADEMVEAVVPRRIKPFGHGLHALALARTDQARHIERTHLPPLLVPQQGNKRLQKIPQRFIPARHGLRSNPGANLNTSTLSIR